MAKFSVKRECDHIFLRHKNFTAAKEKKKPEEERYAPRFNVRLRDRKIVEGCLVTLECFVDAKPTATVKWMKDGQPVEEGVDLFVEYIASAGKCRLTIPNFRPTDEGVYKCVATNELGVADTTAKLTLDSECHTLTVEFIFIQPQTSSKTRRNWSIHLAS